MAVIPKDADATPVIFGDRAAIGRAILPADAVAYLNKVVRAFEANTPSKNYPALKSTYRG
jgi:hypothetical protein